MDAALGSDFRFALRQLRKAPGFAIAAVLTLALGIGVTTAVYSLVDGVLLRPLPLPHPENLVAIRTQVHQPGGGPWEDDTSYPDYLDWAANNRSFSGIAAVVPSARLISRANGSNGAVLPVNRVSADYFDVLGVHPLLGRTFAVDEEQPGRHVTIISYSYWERALALDKNALGSTILISDVPYTIIGVMPKGFLEPRRESADVWACFALYLEGKAPIGKDRKSGIAEVVGRLKPGFTPDQARAELSHIQSARAQHYPDIRFRNSVTLQPKLADLTGDIRPALLMLMASVLAVLLIVCTNVAGLMLSRTMKRRGEIALRTALGASQWRVWRQLLMESSLLGLLGGVAGVSLAYLLLHLTLPLIPEEVPRIGEVAINGRVLCFTVAVALACALLSSLVPAWKLSRTDPIEALREAGHIATAGRRALHFQNNLVIVQTALGLVLLLASGLLIRGFLNLRHVRTGFDAEHLFRFDLPLTLTRYPNATRPLFYNNLLPRLAVLPGVQRVSGGYPLPFLGDYPEVPIEIGGRANPPDRPLTTLISEAEPGFFETLSIPLMRGRTFTAADNDVTAPYVMVVNQAFAKRYFPHDDPIGRRVRPVLDGNGDEQGDSVSRQQREIIGVVGDTVQQSAIEPPQPLAIFPYAQASAMRRPQVVLRVAGDPMAYEKSAQTIVSSIDPALFLLVPGSMTMQIGRASGSQRFETILVSGFAAMALFLTALGLYATLTAMVADRTREIGLRMALGAERSGVALLVLNRAARLLLVGSGLGVVCMLAASRLLAASDWWRPLLFGVSWFEPGTYFVILLVLAAVSIAACLLPTQRAVRVDPVRALRDE